jgi:hypothetical protein
MSSSEWITRFARPAMLVILVFAGALRQDVNAQQVLCAPIRPGDTAARLAYRLTGDPDNTRQPWFQILDPATATFVSKSSYDRILAGWRACLVDQQMALDASRRRAVQPIRASVARARDWLRDAGTTVGLWCVLVVLIAFLLHGSDQYLRQRAMVLAVMKRFADGFIREFERPLIEPGVSERPIRARVRFAPGRARLDVLLAPAAGRRYPNLADHRRNVEYDVMRVLHSLDSAAFVGGRPYARGGWIVVPFQFTNNPDHRGRAQ